MYSLLLINYNLILKIYILKTPKVQQSSRIQVKLPDLFSNSLTMLQLQPMNCKEVFPLETNMGFTPRVVRHSDLQLKLL